jgi:glucokinase
MILAGDIGGTSTRLAAYEPVEGQLRAVVEKTYRSTQFPSLNDIVAKFLGEHSLVVKLACCGIAGPVIDNSVKATNLPWFIEGASLARQFGLDSFVLINDLEANAWGVPALAPSDLVTLNAGEPGVHGNAAVIAAGTGLGEAGLYWDGKRHRPFACEGGHADFAPRTETEIGLLRYLTGKFGRVSYERVVSGMGLCNIHEFLSRLPDRHELPEIVAQLAVPDADIAALVSQAALENRSPVCVEALDLMVSIYGAEAGNAALKFMAYGGLYIGGGIAPKIITKMRDGTFMRAYLAKGRMGRIVAAMPVHVIMNPNTALLGAARCAIQHAS